VRSTLEDKRSLDAGRGSKQRRSQASDAAEGTWQGTPARKMAGAGSRAWGGDEEPAGRRRQGEVGLIWSLDGVKAVPCTGRGRQGHERGRERE
jgi:hypothetical protein